jgi:hypothetical protein
VNVGGSGGTNSATDSTGVAQVGGGNASTGSAGTVQSGPVDATPSVGSTPVTTASAASAPAAAAGEPSPGNRVTVGLPAPTSPRNTFGVTRTPNGGPQRLGQLPFTGLGLALVVLLGLILLATGLTTRARLRPSV